MNSLVKAAIAGVLALGASGAFAAVGSPSSGSSDLLLVIENATTHNAYALDTGISLDSLLPTGSLVSNAVLNTSISAAGATISASAALQSFLSTNPASGDLWTLEGGQYAGGGTANATNSNTRTAGQAKAIFTSANGTVTNANAGTKVLLNIQTYLNGLTPDLTATTGGLFPLSSSSETTAATVSTAAEGRYGFWGNTDFSSVGSSAVQLFGFGGNNGTGQLQSYILGTATLDATGKLTITGNSTPPPVPLPAAVWLFGSGLLGLFGVSRRRTASV